MRLQAVTTASPVWTALVGRSDLVRAARPVFERHAPDLWHAAKLITGSGSS